MDIYLVGGAVRDKRLGLPVQERDWVVVGATPEEMLGQGYRPVGKDFPVFLHPETREEYALARTERKTGPGYTGFATCADPAVTLEEDLQRRDLTINAMAETPEGTLIDPCGGAADLDNGLLRHVSPAFSEDPVRVLRVARFAARFAQWGFRIAHETNALMRQMVKAGEVDHLVPERVWAEMVRALEEQTPVRFFDVLHGCGALARLFPEIVPLYQDRDLRQHAHADDRFPVLRSAARQSERAAIRFAALVCDIDNTDSSVLEGPRFELLCTRLRTPNAYRKLAEMVLRQRSGVHRATDLSAAGLLDLLAGLDAFRRPERLEDALRVCEAEARARQPGLQDYPPGVLLPRAREAALGIDTGRLASSGQSGPEIGRAIREQRILAIQPLLH